MLNSNTYNFAPNFLAIRKRGSWIWSGNINGNKPNATTNKVMLPPNIPLPPTPLPQPLTHYQNHHHHQQALPVSLNGQSLYSSSNDIYEHLPGENHHMYDLTYEDTAATRHTHKRAIQPLPLDDNAHSSMAPSAATPAVTVNGFVMST